jgi:hypothetical protein
MVKLVVARRTEDAGEEEDGSTVEAAGCAWDGERDIVAAVISLVVAEWQWLPCWLVSSEWRPGERQVLACAWELT